MQSLTSKQIEKAKDFNKWMRKKVQSIHFSNNKQMTKAYTVIYNNYKN